MSQSQLLSSIVPFVEIERPACPKCQAQMLLARIVPARLGIGIQTFECAMCDHVFKTLFTNEDPIKSRALGRWIQGDLRSPT
jgi:transposase-like protein